MAGLSYQLRKTLHQYYMHRERQARDGWNKEADLKLIFDTAKKEGWKVEAVAGNFRFSKKAVIGYHIIEVTEKTLSTGGKSNIRAENKGLITMILEQITGKRKNGVT